MEKKTRTEGGPYQNFHVQPHFDVFMIFKSIYVQLYKTGCGGRDLINIQMEIRETLSNKKFLLVLDDVWNEDVEKWHLLSAPFQFGARGSTILVTTRSSCAAKVMGSKKVYNLPLLSDGDCASILASEALAFRRPNFDMHSEFKEVAELLAKQCKGMPLAAMSLGLRLRIQTSSKQWADVLISNIGKVHTNAIIGDLRLSYHHLPPYLRPLIAYCSLFPKGYEFDSHELILLWMAQGYLQQSPPGVLNKNKQMEELGCEYLDYLLSLSFFQRSTGNKSRFIMHDLMNDLAQSVAGRRHCRLEDDTRNDLRCYVSEEVRYLSFISDVYGDFKRYKASNEPWPLRTLLPILEKPTNLSYLSNQILKDFQRLSGLRVLSFKGYYISEVPKSIGNLYHLRYLDFSRIDITELPESVCDLYNLQTLLLDGCSKLDHLPTSIHKLVNLRHLCIDDTQSLKEMPRGIGKLTQLHTLSKFIVDMSNGRKITELKELHNLQGTLSIIGIQNIANVHDAMEANIIGKEGLSRLEMNWSREFDGTREKELGFEVLDELIPQTTLATLEIRSYGGQKFPYWVGDRSFCDMVKVSLIGCKSCTLLPPLRQLASLRELYIEGMDSVKVVGPEFFGTGSPNFVAFQSLTNLSFIDMGCWEEWSADSVTVCEDKKIAFPILEGLQIAGCKKLSKVSLARIPSLGELKINGCSELVFRSMIELGSVKKLVLGDISGLYKLDEGIIRSFGAVENLGVYECNQMRYLWEERVACQVFMSLKSLTVKSCQQLESLGDDQEVLPQNLETLELSSCDNLKKKPNWQHSLCSMRRLTIKDCKKLQDFASTTDLKPKTENHK